EGGIADRDPLAVTEVDGLLGIEAVARKQPRGRGSGGEERGLDVQGFEWGGIREPERADSTAPERREVTADFEHGAEVASERADVGARRALDPHVEIEKASIAPGVEQFERRDRHRARGELDLLSLPGKRIGALAIDLDSADAARHLADLAAQFRDSRADLPLGDGGDRSLGGVAQLGALGVIRGGGDAEPDGGEILLVEPDQVGEQPRRRVHTEHQKAGGHRVERSRVADLARSREPARSSDDVVTRDSLRFVDEQDAAAVTGRAGGCRHAFASRSVASRSAASRSLASRSLASRSLWRCATSRSNGSFSGNAAASNSRTAGFES